MFWMEVATAGESGQVAPRVTGSLATLSVGRDIHIQYIIGSGHSLSRTPLPKRLSSHTRIIREQGISHPVSQRGDDDSGTLGTTTARNAKKARADGDDVLHYHCS